MSSESIPVSQKNNFDLLRFVFASIVYLVHSYTLSGSQSLKCFADVLSSELAVQSFFVVSGFLIFMSFEKSSHLASYISKRVRRIYPAYASVIILCAFFGIFLSEISVESYFSTSWLKYLIANLIFLNFIQPELPGLFTHNSFSAVNGALWTLKIEVMFYLCVPFFVWLIRKYGCWQTLLLIYVTSLCYRFGIEAYGIASKNAIYKELLRQLPGQLIYFVSGAFYYYYLPLLKEYWKPILLVAFIVLLGSDLPLLTWLQPLALASVVVSLAYVVPFLGNFGKYGDLSYGIYILHFPILQTLVHVGLFDESPLLGFLTSTVLVIFLSFASWHLIEKRFLTKKSHYLLANQ